MRTRPDLHVHLLLWDYSLLYAGERELLPRLSLGWRTPERVTLCIDNSVPFGSSQHQKIVVVDDAVAFSGGLDLTIRRWDTTAHSAENRQRVDPSGHPYRPFHDVQMMVDGAAAQALAQLARERWCRANGGVPQIEPHGDPWPEAVRAGFHRRRCRHRPHPAALRRRGARCARPRRCSSIPSISPSARSTSRTSSSARR